MPLSTPQACSTASVAGLDLESFLPFCKDIAFQPPAFSRPSTLSCSAFAKTFLSPGGVQGRRKWLGSFGIWLPQSLPLFFWGLFLKHLALEGVGWGKQKPVSKGWGDLLWLPGHPRSYFRPLLMHRCLWEEPSLTLRSGSGGASWAHFPS